MGLKQLIGEEYREVTFGEAGTGQEAFAELSARPWDLLILGATLPDQDGLSLLRRIQDHPDFSRVRVLLMSMRDDPLKAHSAYRLGAYGYVPKCARRADLLKAIRTVLSGRLHFSPSVPLSALRRPVLHPNLSPQEYKVMLAIARCDRLIEIASRLQLNIKTVSTYKYRVFNKLQVKSTADLVQYVIAHKLA